MDFDAVTPEAIREIVAEGIARAERRVAAAVASPDDAFAPTVGELGNAILEIWDVYGYTAMLAYVHADDDVRAAGRDADEALNKWRLQLFERDDVGATVRRVATAVDRGATSVTDDERPALGRWIAETRMAGYGLGPDARAEVAAGRARLVELGVQFNRHVEEDRRTTELAADELDGLPADLVERLAPGVSPGSRLLTMDATDRLPVLERSPDRALRERVVRTWFSQAVAANRPIIEEAIRIRRRLVRLLGFGSWMDLQTAGAMAGSRAAVVAFMDDLSRGLADALGPGVEAMTARLRADTGDPGAVVEEWDWRYYDAAERRDLGVDGSVVAAYLPADTVLDGLFELTAAVFGIRVTEVVDARGWHPDVRRFRFDDLASGEPLGEMLADLFARPGKLPGAWAYPIDLGHHTPDGRPRRPLAGLVASLTPPGPGTPSLLNPHDLETLFHEYGHVLETILGSSAQIPGDERWAGWVWIEAASQIMEHWTCRPEIVGAFARHHRTGEPMPRALLDALPATRQIGAATGSLRLAYLTLVDVGVHGPEDEVDLDEVNRRAWSILPWPFVEGGFYPAQVTHLLTGYDGLLYGYLWAQVYGDDMFSRFEREGTRSAAVGADYRREILSAPWTRPQIERLRRFLGREPNNEAFLRRLGLAGSATSDRAAR
jgi:thimet oligopeptidase